MDIITLALAKKYTEDSLVGVGALKGSPCTIKSKTAITGGTRIQFAWTDTDGVEHTQTVDIMNGVGISNAQIEDNHLIITLTNGSQIDAGVISGGEDDSAGWGNITGDINNQTDLATALAGKVDTEAGKRLSTNDYTDADKQKVQDALTSEDLSGYATETYVTSAISNAIGGALNGSY